MSQPMKSSLGKVLLICTGFGVSFYLGMLLSSHGDYRGISTFSALRTQYVRSKQSPPKDIDYHAYIVKALKHIAIGYRYARSSKTMVELRKTYHLLHAYLVRHLNETTEEALWNVYQNPNNSFSNGTGKDVCPEAWLGNMHGYPFYYRGTGHLLGNCSYAPPFRTLMTVVLSARKMSTSDVGKVASGLAKTHPGVQFIYGGGPKITGQVRSLNATFVKSKEGLTDGGLLNQLVQLVKTKYVLIARDIIEFGVDASLHRIVRMIDYINVDVAAGAHRNRSGYWKIGCYQTKMLNYGYRLIEGYDLSFNSCVYCDYASAPFVVKTSLLRSQKFSEKLSAEFVYVDFFEKLKKDGRVVMNCPDVTFFTESLSHVADYSSSDWVPFMNEWELNRIHPPGRPPLEMPCKQLSGSCPKPTGMSLTPCCMKGLSDMLKFQFIMCEKHKIGCEIDGGTVVGAVKLYGTLPWERDADTDYRETNHTALKGLTGEFKAAGYSLGSEEKPVKCPPLTDKKSVNCGYFGLRDSNWRIELWGATILGIDRAAIDFGVTNYTKILIDGYWYPCYPNPAAFSRNKYGDDIFEHVEHWGVLGHKTGWVPYDTGKFMKCDRPGHHACLNNYLPVGNLQFFEIWL